MLRHGATVRVALAIDEMKCNSERRMETLFKKWQKLSLLARMFPCLLSILLVSCTISEPKAQKLAQRQWEQIVAKNRFNPAEWRSGPVTRNADPTYDQFSWTKTVTGGHMKVYLRVYPSGKVSAIGERSGTLTTAALNLPE